jgi:DNA-directed RNA polymerase delta subunit
MLFKLTLKVKNGANEINCVEEAKTKQNKKKNKMYFYELIKQIPRTGNKISKCNIIKFKPKR